MPVKMITKNEFVNLTEKERRGALHKLENQINMRLASCLEFKEYQIELYNQIEELSKAGFNIGRWEYDVEKEIWGGPSYMDETKDDELVLKSWFGKGVKLDWNNFDFWKEFDEA